MINNTNAVNSTTVKSPNLGASFFSKLESVISGSAELIQNGTPADKEAGIRFLKEAGKIGNEMFEINRKFLNDVARLFQP